MRKEPLRGAGLGVHGRDASVADGEGLEEGRTWESRAWKVDSRLLTVFVPWKRPLDGPVDERASCISVCCRVRMRLTLCRRV